VADDKNQDNCHQNCRNDDVPEIVTLSSILSTDLTPTSHNNFDITFYLVATSDLIPTPHPYYDITLFSTVL
jgi:hypothetical protein